MMRPGRPRIEQNETRRPVSVSLSETERIQLMRLGGSKWLREFLKKLREETKA